MLSKILELGRNVRRLQRRSSRAPKVLRSNHGWLRLEEFEPRVTPSCSVGLVSGVLTASCDSSVNTVTVDHPSNFTVVNGVSFDDSTFNSIQINIGAGGGTVDLLRTPVQPANISEVGTGNVSVNVSPTVQDLAFIRGAVNITGGFGFDSLVVNDQANFIVGHTYEMTATSVTRTGTSLISFGSLMNVVTLNGSGGFVNDVYNVTGTGAIDLTTLNLNAQSDTVNVESTTHALTIHETGSDAVNVSPSAKNLNNIQGAITVVVGGVNGVNLIVNDQNDATGRTYSMTASSIARTGAATISFPTRLNDVALNGGSGANVYNVTGSPALFITGLQTGGGNDTVNVENTISQTQLSVNEEGSGNDTVNVSPSARNLNNIQGTINVLGNAGSDTLVVNDQNETQTGRLFTMTATSIARSQSGTINFGVSGSHMDFVTLNGGAGVGLGGNSYDVLGTGGRVSNLLQTGTGSSGVNIDATTHPLTVNFLGGSQVLDTVNVAVLSHNLNSIQANVTVNNITTASVPRLFVLDDFNRSSGLTYTMTSNSVTRTGAALISYGATRFNVEVDAATETGGNTYNVTGTQAGSFTTLNLHNGGQSGRDIVNVQATSGFLTVHGPSFGETVNVGNSGGVQAIRGALTLNAPLNLTVNDAPDTTHRSVTMAVSGSGIATISGLAPAVITYDQVNIFRVTVDGGSGGNTFNVQATVTNGLAPVTTVNSGSGNDTINVGDAINTLNEIRGALTVNGQAGFDTLNINDQGSGIPHHYVVTATTVVRSRPGEPTITITYADIESLNLHVGAHFGPTGPGPDHNDVDVLSTDANTSVEIDAGGGATVNVGNDMDGLDELQGPLNVTGDGTVALNVNDQMTGAGQEYDLRQKELDRSKAAPITFENLQVEVLNGGANGNLINVDGVAPGIPATVTAGKGGDLVRMRQHDQIEDALTLNGQGNTAVGYVAYTTDVFVDFQLSFATDIASFSGLSQITGGSGNNILVGDGNEDITGGSGRNLMISGGGTGQIIGGGAGDILIGGTTAYDQDFNSLQAILAYWTGSADDYPTRVANLRAGNGVPQLEAQITVFDGGAANTITGHGNQTLGILNLFYVTEAGTVTDQQPDEVVVDIDAGGNAPHGATGRSASSIGSSVAPNKETTPLPLSVSTVDRLFAATAPLFAVSLSRHDAELWGSDELWS